MRHRHEQGGFSLAELLIVVVVIGILAAIGIPRLLSQRSVARDAAAISDLRNLVAVEVGLEAAGGVSVDPGVLAGEGWTVSDPAITVCGEVLDGGDFVLTAWHAAGTTVYRYQRSTGGYDSGELVPLPVDCAQATGGTGVPLN